MGNQLETEANTLVKEELSSSCTIGWQNVHECVPSRRPGEGQLTGPPRGPLALKWMALLPETQSFLISLSCCLHGPSSPSFLQGWNLLIYLALGGKKCVL